MCVFIPAPAYRRVPRLMEVERYWVVHAIMKTRVRGGNVMVAKRFHIMAAAALVLFGAAGCGSQPRGANPPPAHVHHAKSPQVAFGPTVLKTGDVWELNNPGNGTPREEFTIQRIRGQRVDAQVYLGSFGSLLEAQVTGRLSSSQSLTMSGTITESSATGNNQTIPIQILIKPVDSHTLWVTQTIAGDAANSFTQIPFTEGATASAQS